ncbi:hypothetical protein ANO14919_085460 [Xylariales sp. No.14919]|nr:hypothetical protein ANO14919_085460 [Xylariales sp. No.14919]
MAGRGVKAPAPPQSQFKYNGKPLPQPPPSWELYRGNSEAITAFLINELRQCDCPGAGKILMNAENALRLYTVTDKHEVNFVKPMRSARRRQIAIAHHIFSEIQLVETCTACLQESGPALECLFVSGLNKCTNCHYWNRYCTGPSMGKADKKKRAERVKGQNMENYEESGNTGVDKGSGGQVTSYSHGTTSFTPDGTYSSSNTQVRNAAEPRTEFNRDSRAPFSSTAGDTHEYRTGDDNLHSRAGGYGATESNTTGTTSTSNHSSLQGYRRNHDIYGRSRRNATSDFDMPGSTSDVGHSRLPSHLGNSNRYGQSRGNVPSEFNTLNTSTASNSRFQGYENPSMYGQSRRNVPSEFNTLNTSTASTSRFPGSLGNATSDFNTPDTSIASNSRSQGYRNLNTYGQSRGNAPSQFNPPNTSAASDFRFQDYLKNLGIPYGRGGRNPPSEFNTAGTTGLGNPGIHGARVNTTGESNTRPTPGIAGASGVPGLTRNIGGYEGTEEETEQRPSTKNTYDGDDSDSKPSKKRKLDSSHDD